MQQQQPEIVQIPVTDTTTMTIIVNPFNKLREKEYRKTKGKGILVGAFMRDLQNSAAFINSGTPVIVIQDEDNLTIISPQEFKQRLQEIQITKNKKITVTGWDVYNCFQNSDLITYKSKHYYSVDPEFSFF